MIHGHRFVSIGFAHDSGWDISKPRSVNPRVPCFLIFPALPRAAGSRRRCRPRKCMQSAKPRAACETPDNPTQLQGQHALFSVPKRMPLNFTDGAGPASSAAKAKQGQGQRRLMPLRSVAFRVRFADLAAQLPQDHHQVVQSCLRHHNAGLILAGELREHN